MLASNCSVWLKLGSPSCLTTEPIAWPLYCLSLHHHIYIIRFPHPWPPSLARSDATVFQSLILLSILPIPLVPRYKGIKFMDTSTEMPFSQRLLLGMCGGPLPIPHQGPGTSVGKETWEQLQELQESGLDDDFF